MDNKIISAIGTVVISVLIVIGFFSIYAFAYKYNDTDTVKFLNGIISGMTTAVVMFFIGSSVGSRTKDEAIERIQQQSISTLNFPKTPH